jgi:hypothetical protein
MPEPDMMTDADSAPPAAPEAPPEPQEEEGEKDTDARNSETAEIPKAVLGGKDFKPGDEVVLEVTRVMEDSVLVKYASGEENKAPPAPPTPPAAPAPPAPPGAGGGMRTLMQ